MGRGGGGAGSCASQDNTTILDHVEAHTLSTNIATARRHDLHPDDMEVPHIEPLSENKETAISYIAGHVVTNGAPCLHRRSV